MVTAAEELRASAAALLRCAASLERLVARGGASPEGLDVVEGVVGGVAGAVKRLDAHLTDLADDEDDILWVEEDAAADVTVVAGRACAVCAARATDASDLAVRVSSRGGGGSSSSPGSRLFSSVDASSSASLSSQAEEGAMMMTTWVAPHEPKRLFSSVGGDEPCVLKTVAGVLIDLDGTMYTPSGLLKGADDLYAYLLRHRIPHVFVSNTGAKGAIGVQSKLAACEGAFALEHWPVPLDRIVTAAEETARYVARHVPRGSKLFVLAGGVLSPLAGGGDAWWLEALRDATPRDVFESWDVRTYLKESDARKWAVQSSKKVAVVLFSDGEVAKHIDPKTGERGFADWSFDCFKKASYLLSHGAQLIVTAEDAFNPAHDQLYPGHVFPLPGPGMFAAAFRKLVYPLGDIVTIGKGGESGKMLDEALLRLKKQGCDIDRDRANILIIGDRFDTDVAAGCLAGLKTCLVESGAHDAALQASYPNYPATYVANGVVDLLPPSAQSYHRAPRRASAGPAPPAKKKEAAAAAAAAATTSSSSSTRPTNHHKTLGRSFSVEELFNSAAAEEPRKLVAWALAMASTTVYGRRRQQLLNSTSLVPLLADFFHERCVDGYLAANEVRAACDALGVVVEQPPSGAISSPSASSASSSSSFSETTQGAKGGDQHILSLPKDALTLAQFIALIRSRLGDADVKMFPPPFLQSYPASPTSPTDESLDSSSSPRGPGLRRGSGGVPRVGTHHHNGPPRRGRAGRAHDRDAKPRGFRSPDGRNTATAAPKMTATADASAAPPVLLEGPPTTSDPTHPALASTTRHRGVKYPASAGATRKHTNPKSVVSRAHSSQGDLPSTTRNRGFVITTPGRANGTRNNPRSVVPRASSSHGDLPSLREHPRQPPAPPICDLATIVSPPRVTHKKQPPREKT